MIQLTLTQRMTTARVVETSVTVNNNSPIQDYVHPDDQTQPTFEITPGFKPFTQLKQVEEWHVIVSCDKVRETLRTAPTLLTSGGLTVILIFVDEDECSTGMAACGLYASCKDTSSYYNCYCPRGFLMGKAHKEDCQDIDECKEKKLKCHEDAVCKNTIGSYTCQCKNGFKGNGRFCSDINECENSANRVLYYDKR